MPNISQKSKNASLVIEQYKGTEPLHHFLKIFFKENKKMGSNDRKYCRHLVYSYYRIANVLSGLSVDKKIRITQYLFTEIDDESIYVNDFFALKNTSQKSIVEKKELLENIFPEVDFKNLFPSKQNVSDEIDLELLSNSVLHQPKVFIRINESDLLKFENHLKENNITYWPKGITCIAFEPNIQLEKVFDVNYNYEVQDYSSQQITKFLEPQKSELWLDCCAASGGKSLLLFSKESTVKIIATDIRKNILENLKLRFQKNKLSNFQVLKNDFSVKTNLFPKNYFDGVIADVPCSGSGTWGRNPENLFYFDDKKLLQFQQLQYSILSNVVEHLKIGQNLIYITCSIYKIENEDVITKSTESLPLKLKSINYIVGFEHSADTMFCAVLTKI